MDLRQRFITFRELKGILKRFGYELSNPSGNYIEVIRVEERRKIFGILGQKERINVKIDTLGFPGWTRQVDKTALRQLRQKLGLIPEKGIDSRAFYEGSEPFYSLLDRHSDAIRRLAVR